MMNPQLDQGNFYGDTLKNFQAAGFTLSETRYVPHSKLPRHSHEAPYFGFVLRGTYSESYGRETRLCRPSMLIYHPAGELHAQCFNTAVQLFRLEVSQRMSGSLRRANVGLDQPAVFDAGLITILARRLYHEFRNPDEVSHLVVEGLALELIAAIARGADPRKRISSQPPGWLQRARELVKSRCAESFTTADVARMIDVHPLTLSREFRRHYRCSIGDMVRGERIALACRRILAGARLADVAATAGFYDQSHFAKTFKRITGLTPGQYRANCRR
jgi:AraC family transcriptional regulator